MSITKAQAADLAAGFLDFDGSDDKSDLVPRETLTEIFLIAGECVEDMQDNLINGQHVASGNLSESIELKDPVQFGSIVSIDIVMSFYGLFLNKGVKGTKSGVGLYAFKTSYPSKDMVKALAKSISRARFSTSNSNRNKTTSGNERKNFKVSDVQKAYGAGVNIKRYGIKPTGFIDKAVANLSRKVGDRLGAALKVDIINSI